MRRGLERRLLRVVDVVRFECIMLAVLIVGVCSVFSQDTSLLNVAVLIVGCTTIRLLVS